MHEEFVATVAVTIPILMLAGTVELRSLADTVAVRTTSAAHASTLVVLKFTKHFAQLRAGGSGRVAGFARSVRTAVAGLSPTLATAILLLPFLWLGVLLLAVLCELWSLLFLAGVTVGSSAALAIFSIVVVGCLMLFLVGTPAVRTLYAAPHAGLQKFAAGLRDEAGRDVLEGLSEAVTAAAEAGWVDPVTGVRVAAMVAAVLSDAGIVPMSTMPSAAGAASHEPADPAAVADPGAAAKPADST